MLAHHRGEDLLRQLEVALLEGPEDAVRCLDEVGDLVDECGLALDVDNAADRRGQRVSLGHNALPPLSRIDDEVPLGELGQQDVGVLDLDERPGLGPLAIGRPPNASPDTETGTTVSPQSATIHRIGRL